MTCTVTESSVDNYKLLILVLSARDNYAQRQSIRDTWKGSTDDLRFELRISHMLILSEVD